MGALSYAGWADRTTAPYPVNFLAGAPHLSGRVSLHRRRWVQS